VIRSVVFDIGGVLVSSPLDEFGKFDAEHGLREGTAMSLFRGGSRFVHCETGRMPFAEFCAGAVADIHADHGVTVTVERLGAMMGGIVGGGVDEPMRALGIELKAAGLQIGLCSNIYAEVDDWIRAIFPPGTVDFYCLSYAVGQRKPEPAMYSALLEMSGYPAQDIMFIDDWAENVDGARAVGIAAVQFTDVAALRAQLNAAGILRPPAA
jgi:hypothetical protein